MLTTWMGLIVFVLVVTALMLAAAVCIGLSKPIEKTLASLPHPELPEKPKVEASGRTYEDVMRNFQRAAERLNLHFALAAKAKAKH